MLIIDDNNIKVGGVILPGILKSIEVKNSAKIDEVDIKGKGVKPKQAVGFQDTKINIELRLIPDDESSIEDKLDVIQNIFRKDGQKKPNVYPIVSDMAGLKKVSKVMFKDLNNKYKTGKNEMSASLEFWEYIPFTIKSVKRSGGGSRSTKKKDSALDAKYRAYLSSRGAPPTESLDDKYRTYLASRGTGAPKISNKYAKSPARDTQIRGSRYVAKLSDIPYY